MDRERTLLRVAVGLGLVMTAPLAGDCQESPARVRVACISFEPVKLDIRGNARRLTHYFREAAAGGAKIAVAPEGILDGYIVNEIIRRDMDAERMRDVAVTIDSSLIQEFQSLARELQMCLVFGFAERIGDSVFNTAVFLDHRGRICGKYHKMQFHEGYDPSWWFNRLGEKSRAFDTPYGRCGILICNDRWNPLLARIPALDGAQFLVVPSFGSTAKKQDEAVLARGVETGLPVVEANVGVSLVVSKNKIVAVERQQDGVTYADIAIPPARKIDVAARDRTEAEFLRWRNEQMPMRLASFLEALEPAAVAEDQHVAMLSTSELKLLIGDNHSLDIDDRQHLQGYNGISSLESTEHAREELESGSVFVTSYAGLNLEHYFDAQPQDERSVFFEPRFAPMTLKRVSDRTVELHQPTTPFYQVESWTRFSVKEPNYIDFSFRCVPHRDDYRGGFLGVFWASYINGPLNKSIYFLDASSSLDKPLWRQFCTQEHNRDSTVRSAKDQLTLRFEKAETLFSNVSPLRYSEPFFFGRYGPMVLIYMFRPAAGIRFAHSPSGGGPSAVGDDTNPAWDFQFIIPDPKQGNEYRLSGRLVYKRWRGRSDVLNEVRRFRESVPQ